MITASIPANSGSFLAKAAAPRTYISGVGLLLPVMIIACKFCPCCVIEQLSLPR